MITNDHPTLQHYLKLAWVIGFPKEPLLELIEACQVNDSTWDALEELFEADPPETYDQAFKRLKQVWLDAPPESRPPYDGESTHRLARLSAEEAQKRYERRFDTVDLEHTPALKQLKEYFTATIDAELVAASLRDHTLVLDEAASRGARLGDLLHDALNLYVDAIGCGSAVRTSRAYLRDSVDGFREREIAVVKLFAPLFTGTALGDLMGRLQAAAWTSTDAHHMQAPLQAAADYQNEVVGRAVQLYVNGELEEAATVVREELLQHLHMPGRLLADAHEADAHMLVDMACMLDLHGSLEELKRRAALLSASSPDKWEAYLRNHLHGPTDYTPWLRAVLGHEAVEDCFGGVA